MNPLNFYKYLPYLLRKKIKGRYIAIESDDWGLERALTIESLDWTKKKFGEEKFTRWTTDALETSEDLNLLFDLLESYKTKFESSPIITANFITHNFNYKDKNSLSFIPISNGFNFESEDVRTFYNIGIEKKYIFPQLHGYTHYNLTELKKYFDTEEAIECIGNKFFLARTTIKGNLHFLYGELSKNNLDANPIENAIKEFEKFFGLKSETIIPSSFIFDIELTDLLKKNNIKLLQAGSRLLNSENKNYLISYFKKFKGIIWSARNARLDPHPEYNFYSDQCLNSIEKAFAENIPAIIDFHRVNFSGKYNSDYRNRTLKELKILFDTIYKKWSDTKFIHSQDLLKLYGN